MATVDAGQLGREAGAVEGKVAKKTGAKPAATKFQGVLDVELYQNEAQAALAKTSLVDEYDRVWFVKAYRVAYHQALGGGCCRARE